MNLDNVILNYEKTIPGIDGDIILQEGKYYKHLERATNGTVYYHYFYVIKFVSREVCRIFNISLSYSDYTYRVMEHNVRFDLLRRVTNKKLHELGLSETIPGLARIGDETRENWNSRIKNIPAEVCSSSDLAYII